MYEVIEMDAQPDDVSIYTVAKFPESISMRDLYDFVKTYVMSEVRYRELHSTDGEKYLIKMDDTEDGLPLASVYINKLIKKQVFVERQV